VLSLDATKGNPSIGSARTAARAQGARIDKLHPEAALPQLRRPPLRLTSKTKLPSRLRRASSRATPSDKRYEASDAGNCCTSYEQMVLDIAGLRTRPASFMASA